jgi:hypothetical protein
MPGSKNIGDTTSMNNSQEDQQTSFGMPDEEVEDEYSEMELLERNVGAGLAPAPLELPSRLLLFYAPPRYA